LKPWGGERCRGELKNIERKRSEAKVKFAVMCYVTRVVYTDRRNISTAVGHDARVSKVNPRGALPLNLPPSTPTQTSSTFQSTSAPYSPPASESSSHPSPWRSFATGTFRPLESLPGVARAGAAPRHSTLACRSRVWVWVVLKMSWKWK